MFLVIHGFTSSSQSHKAQALLKWLSEQGREDEWVCPDLPIDPLEAMQLLSDIIENADTPPKLVGSSLGGFYATVLSAKYSLKAVLINPAVHAGLVLRQAVGPQKAWHSEQTYEFTQAHVDSLNAMDLLEPADPDKLFLMVEMADETLDWQRAASFYRDCHQLIFRGGDHSFTRFEQVLPLIDAF
ncbi:MAG: hypothetical protein CSB47_10200 [Proteobacteria bacterium]|nr:MAG: hypothetical protein CSB47_10200 [Pseudomonadota bacterium]